MALSTRAPDEALKTKPKVVPELPSVGLSLVETRNARFDFIFSMLFFSYEL